MHEHPAEYAAKSEIEIKLDAATRLIAECRELLKQR
jgi:hypothetical protein